MDNCVTKLSENWTSTGIVILALTYIPQDDSKNRLIDERNCVFESISIDLHMTFFANQSNMRHLIA